MTSKPSSVIRSMVSGNTCRKAGSEWEGEGWYSPRISYAGCLEVGHLGPPAIDETSFRGGGTSLHSPLYPYSPFLFPCILLSCSSPPSMCYPYSCNRSHFRSNLLYWAQPPCSLSLPSLFLISPIPISHFPSICPLPRLLRSYSPTKPPLGPLGQNF